MVSKDHIPVLRKTIISYDMKQLKLSCIKGRDSGVFKTVIYCRMKQYNYMISRQLLLVYKLTPIHNDPSASGVSSELEPYRAR
jgi:hypothetical protein